MNHRLTTIWLSEALRHHPDARALLDDSQARAGALAGRGSDEARLTRWLQQLGGVEGLRAALQSVWRSLVIVVGLILLVALLAGAGSVKGALAMQPVDIQLALLMLVGIQLAFLLLWLLVALFAGRSGGNGSGPGFFALQGMRLLKRQQDYQLALLGLADLLGRQRLGFWSFGMLTHLWWLLFSLSAIIVGLVLLHLTQHDFAWGSTLLADDQVIRILLALAGLPAVLGFPVPDADLIQASRLGGELPGSGREVWGWFLIGCLVSYGLLPRLLAALVCMIVTLHVLRRLQVDPGYALYQGVLLQLKRADIPPALGTRPAQPQQRLRTIRTQTAFGPNDCFALIGLELDASERWPPPVDNRHCILLGHVGTRNELARVLSDLTTLTPAPRFVAIMVSLLRTPDRGSMDTLIDISQATSAPLLVILTEADQLPARGIDRNERETEWRKLLDDHGLKAVLVADWTDIPGLRQAQMEDHLQRSWTAT